MFSSDIESQRSRDALSALADGQAGADEAELAFAAWRADDDDVQATWHAYHLIGDVLRSEDLASAPASDQSLLLAVRARLATEAVVLAPGSGGAGPQDEPSVAGPRRQAGWLQGGRWQAPAAMAAGFVAMVVGLQFVRAGGPLAGQATVAAATASASATLASATPASAAPAGVTLASATPAAATPTGATLASAQVPRAATQSEAQRLAPYLAAHRQSSMNGAYQMPDGDVRNASLVVPGQ